MLRSSSPNTNHEGIRFRSGSPEGSCSASSVAGRCVAAIRRALASSTSAQNHRTHRSAGGPATHDGPLPGIPPLLELVPQAGPPVFVYAGFGVLLQLLLVPPFTLLATLIAVALVVAASLAVLAALAGALLATPVLLVRGLRGHRLPRVSLPVQRVH
jgi:hypothetical protein